MPDRDLIRQLVAEEIARPEVQANLAAAANRDLWGRIGGALRHPLSVTIAGFFLTALVGSQIQNRLAESQRHAQERETRIERAHAQEEDARATVQDFVSHVYHRAVEADLLRSAIQRKSTPELLPRKAAYDEAFREWNKRQPEHFYALRSVWAGGDRALITKRSPYEEAVLSYIDRDFGAADECLTRHFDAVADEVVTDSVLANTPGNYCHDADWVRTVLITTIRARNCAVAIQAISLAALRRRTDEVVDAILRNDPPPVGAILDHDDLRGALKDSCDADLGSRPDRIELGGSQ